MKHEYTAILNHLRVKHNMTLTQYTQTYIKPGTGTSPGQLDEAEETEQEAREEEQEELVEQEEREMATSSEDQFYVVYSDTDQNPTSE